MNNQHTDIDPITLAVVEGTLASAIREMGIVMRRTARSPVLAIGNDFSNGIFDGQARMIYQGDDQPVHLGGLIVATKEVAAYFGEDIAPGDVLYHNDPLSGGSHLPDQDMLKPIFFDDQLLFWVANRSHMNETGGPVPGGYNPEAEELYAEGLRIPPIKIVEAGRERYDIWNLIITNVRTKRQQRGDMAAQLGALNAAEARLVQLVEKYGPDTVTACLALLLDRAERVMREEISALPDGVYTGFAMIDDDGHGSGDMKLVSEVTIDGAEMHVRVNTTDLPRANSFINSYHANTLSGVLLGVLTVVDPESPHNEGLYRPIHVDVGAEGSLTNAVEPAACGFTTNCPFDNIVETIRMALSQAKPTRAVAGSAHGYHTVLTGVDKRTDDIYSYLSHMSCYGGGGASWGIDGRDVLGVVAASGASMTGDIELIEYAVPLIIHQYELRPDSACPGRWQGGFGAIYDVELVDHTAVATNYGEGVRFQAPSLLDAATNLPNEDKIFHRFLVTDGERKRIEPPSVMHIGASERILSYTPGGGGVGPNLERPIDLVWQDVRDELLSVKAAEKDYGVVVDPETLEIDHEATAQRRGEN